MKNLIITLLLAGLTHAVFAAPATWVQSITYNSETITMRLTQETLRGSEFELWSQNASGGYDVVTPVAERSYIGSVDGYPGAVSCGILQDDGTFRGAVYFDRGATWFTLGNAVVDTHGYEAFNSFQFPTAPTVGSGQAGSTMIAYDLGVDADYDYFSDAGSIAKAFEGIEYSVCVVRAIYMRDVLLRPYLGRVIIRKTLAQDPYTGLTQGDYLNAVKDEWNNNHTAADRDLVVGASPTKMGGGLAFVGKVGSNFGYSTCQCNSSGNFDVVFRHEMGHNWGCGHYVGGLPEGPGIMGGNKSERFSGCEVYVMLNHRDSRTTGILDDEGTYTAIEIPPYASMDTGVFVQTVTSSLTVDVLANDHDANGQAVSLDSYDGTSANGGTVTQQGQNLVYTAPGAFLGDDYFMYTITDTAGRTATGVVIIKVEFNEALRLYLPLDETTGTTAVDYSTFLNNGTLSTNFTVASVAGQYANAVNFDGINDYIEVSDMDLRTERMTLAAWIKPNATQNNSAGIVFDRSTSASGLGIHSDRKLCYHWNDMAQSYNWNSNLIPPADSWTFVALVVEPTRAIIYMNSGSGFQSATNNISHAAATFGTTYIGRDPNAGRYFTGAIDDVRLYNESMTPLELQNMYDGGSAGSSRPFDGAADVASSVLRWTPAPAATAYDVYIGTSQAAVAAATKASPEYQETTVDAFLYSSFLSDSTAYFWRIDTVTASTTLVGSVWSFSTGTLPPPGDTILVNFEQSFSGGELIGPTADDSSNWNTVFGASGAAASLIDNSGVPSTVDIQWKSRNTWSNSDGTSDDEHRLSVGYLDDGNSGDGKGVTITLNNIPYAIYRVYGLFATDYGDGMVNFDVNGAWALGGSASTTASAWASINDNYAMHGEYWTEIESGVTRGNYWTITTTGTTCTITGEPRNVSKRGSLTAVIIEKLQDTDGDGSTDDIDPDDDNDGIPDTWEIARGLDPLVDDQSAHSDSDSFDNWHEYMTDTDPLDETSFQTTSFEIDPASDNPALRFGSSTNRRYTVQYRTNLLDGIWQNLEIPALGLGSEMTISDPAAGSRRYYRIRVELP